MTDSRSYATELEGLKATELEGLKATLKWYERTPTTENGRLVSALIWKHRHALIEIVEAASEVRDIAATLPAFIDDPVFHQVCSVLNDRLNSLDAKGN